jgi:membrane protease YdiL (CAAX protease family)
MNEYLNLVSLGKNIWWRYLLSILTILFSWQVIGSLPLVLLFLWTMVDNNPSTDITNAGFNGMDIRVYFIAFMLSSWAFMAGLFLVMRFIHHRSLLTLITPAKTINWTRLFQGFGVWFLMAAFLNILESLLYPGRYEFNLDLRIYIPFLFVALLMIPIQTSAEEMFFRGYLLQAFGLRIQNIWLLSILSGLFFGLPHLLNPEASTNYLLMGIYYIAFGTVLAYITLRDGKLELALGMHAANNLLSALFANYQGSVMPTPALFTIVDLDVNYTVISALTALVIFVIIFTVKWGHKTKQNSITGIASIDKK